MTRWPRYASPGWLLAYTLGAALWILAYGVSPLALLIVLACAGLLGLVAIGNLFDCGHVVPPEERR